MFADLNDLKFERWLRMRENGELKWKTKNGDEISIKNMSDYHLENAINMLERQCENPDTDELRCEYEAYVNDLD